MDGIVESGGSLSIVRSELKLAQAYLSAKQNVLHSPYKEELLLRPLMPEDVTESHFLRELAWAVLSGGMAEAVVKKKFPDISRCFFEWESAKRISDEAEKCIKNALCHFRHEGKIKAIATAAHMLCRVGSFDSFRKDVFRNPIDILQSFPYIGPITAFHVAKNIGVGVAKPDRHLACLARSNGFESVDTFCRVIAGFLGEDIRLVDSVLWRFATMHKDYAVRFLGYGCFGVDAQ
jgi:hypothetical protein